MQISEKMLLARSANHVVHIGRVKRLRHLAVVASKLTALRDVNQIRRIGVLQIPILIKIELNNIGNESITVQIARLAMLIKPDKMLE